jgi:ABC-type transport system involved in multi-copper enzyme maturation permease subunit
VSAIVARQMVGAELLKLRRNRDLLIYSLLLTSGVVTLALLWIAVQEKPGGVPHFENTMRLLGSYFGPITAVLVGTEAGAGDRASGVLRDLVITGRSRPALFLVRLPGALALFLPLLALAFAICVVVAVGDPGAPPAPDLSLIVRYGFWLALAGGVCSVISVGFAALIGSRSTATTMLIAWFAVASPLLASVAQLGATRQLLPLVAIEHFKPGMPGEGSVPTASATAVAVLSMWCVGACAAGLWGTCAQDV